MNLYEMRREFDMMCRSSGIQGLEDMRDHWINMGWEKISELFMIPSLVKTTTLASVANQQHYAFPYDYNGTEVALTYLTRRLDPVRDEALKLRFENLSGNMGPVRYYDWSGAFGEDLLVITGCTLTNGSVEVEMSSANALLSNAHWVRFDPYEDETNADADFQDMVNPGDYGYQISAGSFVSGDHFNLTLPYRGPSGDSFTCRVRPAEQQRFKVYGIPSASEDDAFTLLYAAKPRRLFSNQDVPEWPNMGLSIIYMAISVGLEWHHHMDLASTFWGRAMQTIKGLERRRNRSSTLTSDLTIGTLSGRRTGLQGYGGRFGLRRFR